MCVCIYIYMCIYTHLFCYPLFSRQAGGDCDNSFSHTLYIYIYMYMYIHYVCVYIYNI